MTARYAECSIRLEDESTRIRNYKQRVSSLLYAPLLETQESFESKHRSRTVQYMHCLDELARMRNKLDREILTTLEETYYAIFDLEDSLDAKNQEIEVLQSIFRIQESV
jgi:hypothetical protein